jgi:hypothetical protein
LTHSGEAMDALRAFMCELIDYAGLFPPASLDMSTSVREYARLRREAEAWMLGRFVVPAGRLPELADCLAETRRLTERAVGVPDPDPPWRLAVIVDSDDQKVVAATSAMRRVVEGSAGSLLIETVETRLPPGVVAQNGAGAVSQHASALEGRLAEAGFAGLPVFFEAAGGNETMLSAVRGIAEHRGGGPAPGAGLKLRCGGPRSEDVPPAERVASVIAECTAAGVPLKLTAGLHHPLRRLVSPPDGWQHGFLNVVGAGVLTASGRLGRAETLACLLEEDAGSFRFDGRFAWRDHAATPAEIADARRGLMVGFGSCSFAEPRDDLRALGLLS